MKLTALIAHAAVAGTMMLATAPAHSAAVVFESYDYSPGDAASVFVTNTGSVSFDDVTFFGSYQGQMFHYGPLAAGASTSPFYLGDNENDFPGSQGNVTVSILIGSKHLLGHVHRRDRRPRFPGRTRSRSAASPPAPCRNPRPGA